MTLALVLKNPKDLCHRFTALVIMVIVCWAGTVRAKHESEHKAKGDVYVPDWLWSLLFF